MTQDQPGQGQGTDYVVRGEVVPDDETEATQAEQSGPMTRFKRVASALRGDTPDQTAGDQAGVGGDPDLVGDDEYADATRPNDVSAVRSPDAGGPDSWEDEQDVDATIPDETRAEETGALGPAAVGPDTYPTTAPVGTVPTSSYADEADTGAGYGSQAATTPGNGGPAMAVTTEGSPAGKHAAAADAGLRPGEATERLGDFGDIAFGNLLPDAEQYSARWQQIQFRFVDDPQGSVTEAADVVSQVTAKLEAAIQERQRAIEERQQAIQERASALRGRWGEGSNADTETLRETLRMYRGFMDQLIGTTP
jgi:hypothetical protein